MLMGMPSSVAYDKALLLHYLISSHYLQRGRRTPPVTHLARHDGGELGRVLRAQRRVPRHGLVVQPRQLVRLRLERGDDEPALAVAIGLESVAEAQLCRCKVALGSKQAGAQFISSSHSLVEWLRNQNLL